MILAFLILCNPALIFYLNAQFAVDTGLLLSINTGFDSPREILLLDYSTSILLLSMGLGVFLGTSTLRIPFCILAITFEDSISSGIGILR